MKLASVWICAALVGSLGAAPAISASMRAALTPEERTLYVQQIHGANWRSLSIQQRCARMEQVRAEWRSMSPAAQNRLKQQLAARLQTMPVAQKQKMDQRLAAREARRAQNGGHQGQGRCAGERAVPAN